MIKFQFDPMPFDSHQAANVRERFLGTVAVARISSGDYACRGKNGLLTQQAIAQFVPQPVESPVDPVSPVIRQNRL